MADENYRELGAALVDLCRRAGAAIEDIYWREQAPEVILKADSSPVTEADYASHQLLMDGLRHLTPSWPILSEEAELPPFQERSRWSRYWLVDPLDGTREFIHRSGEFTVNIALIERGVPVMGAVGVPLQKAVYLGIPGDGATLFGDREIPLSVSSIAEDRVRVLAGSRHRGKKLTACCEKLQRRWPVLEAIKAGSALKFCLLAEGRGDIYPRFSPCSEWDTAAGQALLEAAGGRVVDLAFKTLRYNTQPSVASPHFYALGGQNIDWEDILGSG